MGQLLCLIDAEVKKAWDSWVRAKGSEQRISVFRSREGELTLAHEANRSRLGSLNFLQWKKVRLPFALEGDIVFTTLVSIDGPSLSSLCGQYTNSLKERSGMKAASTFAGKKDYNVKVCQHFQAQDHGVRGWRLPTRQGSEEVAAAEISSEEVKDPFHEGVKNLGNVCRCSDAHCNASFWEAKTWVRGQPGPHSENNKNEKKFRNTGGMCRIWDHLESGFSLNKRTMI